MIDEKKVEITLIVLTCKRLSGLKRIINSIINKTNNILYDLLVVIDKGDVDAYKYCLENNIKCLLSSYHRDFVAQTNMAVYICETPYFVTLTDDLEIIDDTWLNMAFTTFKEKFPDDIGLLGFNDDMQGHKIFTTGMSSKAFVEKMGYNFFYPGYKHYGSDTELTILTKKLGCYHYEDSIHLLHHHRLKTGIIDDTYIESI